MGRDASFHKPATMAKDQQFSKEGSWFIWIRRSEMLYVVCRMLKSVGELILSEVPPSLLSGRSQRSWCPYGFACRRYQGPLTS